MGIIWVHAEEQANKGQSSLQGTSKGLINVPDTALQGCVCVAMGQGKRIFRPGIGSRFEG